MPVHRVQAFAAASEIIGGDHCQVKLSAGATVAELRAALQATYPALGELVSFAVARNEVYAMDDEVIEPGDVLVVIPPVSGG